MALLAKTWGDRARQFKATLHRLKVDMQRPDTPPAAIPWMEALARSGERWAAWMDDLPKDMPLPSRQAGVTCSNAGCTRTVWVNAALLYQNPNHRPRCEECAVDRPQPPLVPATREERLETAVYLAVRLKKHVTALEALGDDWGSLDFLAECRWGTPQRLLFAIGACLDGMRSSLSSNEETDQALRDIGLGWLAGRWEPMEWKGGQLVPSETGRWMAGHHFEKISRGLDEAIKPTPGGTGPIPFDAPAEEQARATHQEANADRHQERGRGPERSGVQRPGNPRGDHRDAPVVRVPQGDRGARGRTLGPGVERERGAQLRDGRVQGEGPRGDDRGVRPDRGVKKPRQVPPDDEWLF